MAGGAQYPAHLAMASVTSSWGVQSRHQPHGCCPELFCTSSRLIQDAQEPPRSAFQSTQRLCPPAGCLLLSVCAAVTLPEQRVPTHHTYLPQGLLPQGTATSGLGAGESLSWEMCHQQCFSCRVYFQGYFLTNNVLLFFSGGSRGKDPCCWPFGKCKPLSFGLFLREPLSYPHKPERFLRARTLSTVP